MLWRPKSGVNAAAECLHAKLMTLYLVGDLEADSQNCTDEQALEAEVTYRSIRAMRKLVV